MCPRYGLCLGVFDLFHVGHLRFLRAAADECQHLIVGVVRDDRVKAHKGPDRPIIPWAERVEIISALADVGSVVEARSFDPRPLLEECRDLWDAPIGVFCWGEDQQHVPTDHLGIPVRIISRTPGVSTTEIVRRLR